jgi:putative superfamily III holin-X
VSAVDTDERSAPELVGDLFRTVLALVRSTARMFGLEAREVSVRVGRRLALLVASTVVVAAGAVVLLAGLSLALERLVEMPRWLALLLVGALAAGAGSCGIVVALRRLGREDVAFPRTVSELEKDLEALQRRGAQS